MNNGGCNAVVNGVLYVVNSWPAIARLGSCGFEIIKDLGALESQHLCAATADSKLLICSGTDCVIFDTETWDLTTVGSLNDFHYEGKMILEPVTNQNLVIGGTHNGPNAAERYNSQTGQWEFVSTPENKSFPLNYRRFSTASGFAQSNPNSYLFSGFAVNDSGNTYFPGSQFCFNSETNEVTEIGPTDYLYPISDIGLNEIFEPKHFDSIGGDGYIVHHRTHECTNSSMR